MRTEQVWQRLDWGLRLGLAGLLAFAGWQKLQEPQVFADQVANYQWLPEVALLVAVFLPPLELLTALGLLVFPRPWRQAAALLAVLLFATFTLAVARAYALGIDVECGCFGVGSGEIGPLTVVRNVLLTAAAGVIWWLAQTRDEGEVRAPG